MVAFLRAGNDGNPGIQESETGGDAGGQAGTLRVRQVATGTGRGGQRTERHRATAPVVGGHDRIADALAALQRWPGPHGAGLGAGLGLGLGFQRLDGAGAGCVLFMQKLLYGIAAVVRTARDQRSAVVGRHDLNFLHRMFAAESMFPRGHRQCSPG